jgi:hypothetical protein
MKAAAATTTTAMLRRLSWQSQIPDIVSHCHIQCQQHTPDSTRALCSSVVGGYFTDGKVLSHDVKCNMKRYMFVAFEEDDYNGALHLMKIHDKDGTTPIGIVFWHEMPEEEI